MFISKNMSENCPEIPTVSGYTSKYHRVLSRAEWDGLVLAKILFGLLIKILPESWPILVAVDETLERRRGKKIKAKGLYRDAVQSTQSNVVTSYGLKWEAMMLIVPLQ